MSSGLLALLDDVSALIKAASVSLDDIPTQVAKTSYKVSGIVIDDAAVTPKYVVGLDPSRELTIIYRIARSSLINKLFILGPAVFCLGYFAPWIVTPLLMLGGCFLCYEGYEKVHDIFCGTKKTEENKIELPEISPEELEKLRVGSAVRTDFILSAEIIAITYDTVSKNTEVDNTLLEQIIIIACVAILITFLVYGSVAVLVKMDDFGLYLAKTGRAAWMRAFGRKIVTAMPSVLITLSYVGTVAMLLVGAEIIAHPIPFLHHGLVYLENSLIDKPWFALLIKSTSLVLGGLVLGAIVEKMVNVLKKFKKAGTRT